MDKKYEYIFMRDCVYNCSITLMLDKRHKKNNEEPLPVVMRFTINKERYYHTVLCKYTEQNFSKICKLSSNSTKSVLFREYLMFKDTFENYRDSILKLGDNLTLSKIRTALTGNSFCKEESFVGVWEEIINRLKSEGRVTTAESYGCALNSFNKILNANRNRNRKSNIEGPVISGFRIGISEIREWCYGMENGVLVDGKLVGKISETTKGIYLRVCRVVWNECVSRKFINNADYPFSNIEKKNLVSIPMGATRKDEYLPVEKMTRLYNVFVNKEYPEKWRQEYKDLAHYSLGLFLVQYLCNGFNLADAGLLKYTDFYFNHDRKAFRFNRKKTSSRSKDGSEVIVPITEELKIVIEGMTSINTKKFIAVNTPQLDAYVFPSILKGYEDPVNVRRRTKQENKNVRERVIRICKEVLGWEIQPSGTWCRHSFATNLTHAGVDRQYISECMGHSTNETVTQRYIAKYPLSTQIKYNSLLLNKKQSISVDEIDSLSKDEMKQLLLEFLSK